MDLDDLMDLAKDYYKEELEDSIDDERVLREDHPVEL